MDIGWIAVAFAAGLGARAARMPPLVGYLAAGMALSAFDVEGGTTLARVGELGVALLLFTVGLDLRLKNLVRIEVLGAGGVHVILVTMLAGLGGLALGLPPVAALLLGSALSVSSIVMAAKMLEEQHDLGSYHGRIAIGILLLQTVVAAAAMVVVGGEAPHVWAVALLLLPLLRPLLSRLLRWTGGGELTLLFGLLLAAGGAALFEAAGVGAELGALVAGALLAGRDESDAMADTLWALKEVFLAAFFLQVGLVGFPSGSGLLIVLALVAFLSVKTALFFGLLVMTGVTARTAFKTSVSLTSYSGFTLVVGAMAVDAAIIDAPVLTILAVATAASYVVNAVFGGASTALWRRFGNLLSRFERDVRHPDAQPHTLGHSQFIVVGMGRAGTAAYDYLTNNLYCTAGLDANPGRLEEHLKQRRRVLFGDARDAALWEELDLDHVEAVVLTIPGAEAKADAVRALRRSGFSGTITALTADKNERKTLLEAGANAVYLSIPQAGRAVAAHAVTQRGAAEPRTVTLDVAND